MGRWLKKRKIVDIINIPPVCFGNLPTVSTQVLVITHYILYLTQAVHAGGGMARMTMLVDTK